MKKEDHEKTPKLSFVVHLLLHHGRNVCEKKKKRHTVQVASSPHLITHVSVG